MEHLVEYIVRKHKHGSNPNSGEIVFSEVLDIKDAANTKAHHVAQKLKSEDLESFEYKDVGVLAILKDRADASFNSKPVKIYERAFKDNIPIEIQKKALERLVKYLNKRDQENIYFKNIPSYIVGCNCYQVSSKSIHKLNIKDREQKLKRLISARKGAVTRTKNKIRKVVDSYTRTLMQDGYKDEPRYISLNKYLPMQEERYQEAISLTVDDIPQYDGSFSK